ncbi:MAG: YfgM family protein [Pseudomonadota bacterium]
MVDIYESEQEQIEALKRWWNENGLSIVLGVVLGLGALLGWYQWQDYQSTRQDLASAEFSVVMEQLQNRDFDGIPERAAKLADDLGNTHYASLAQLAAARVLVDRGDLEGAQARLQWVVDDGTADHYRDAARLRLAQLLIGAGELDRAQVLLGKGLPASYDARQQELLGDLAVAKGDDNAARVAYDKALNADLPLQNPRRVQMKRDNLGNIDLVDS